MQRQWAVRPDPYSGAIDPQELTQAVFDGVTMLNVAGGSLNVVVQRAGFIDEHGRPSLPNERITTGAVVEWRSDVNAKPQPEPDEQIPDLAPVQAPEPEPEPVVQQRRPPDPVIEPDGLDRSTLDEVDESALTGAR